MGFGIFAVLALPAFDIGLEIIRSVSIVVPAGSDLPRLPPVAPRMTAAPLLDLTFGRQVLGNCWVCRISIFPTRAWVRRHGVGPIITKLCMKRHARCFV